jgi:hypothetical protein
MFLKIRNGKTLGKTKWVLLVTSRLLLFFETSKALVELILNVTPVHAVFNYTYSCLNILFTGE